MSELIKYINDLPGYKITDSHFRLGSKIHITHFYYAKRFFQNSFFASRLAFLIVKQILDDHKDKISDIIEGGITVIGYGLYSELLISLVELLLKKKLGTKKVYHDLISDSDEPYLIKNYNTENKYILIIVPIGSTFSTAIKIKEFLSFKWLGKIILEPYINVIHVSHFPSDENDKPDADGLYNIERNFGWIKKDGKTIWVDELIPKWSDDYKAGSDDKNISNDIKSDIETDRKEIVKPTEQKYLLSLKSEWFNVKNCQLCSLHTNYSNERPLFFTDKSSVTPFLIFGMPKARIITESQKFELLPNTLKYGHLKREEKHFHFYIDIEFFFRDNFEAISNWLKKIKIEKEFKEIFKETTKVIIISPGHYTNTGFINLVNEILFSNAANIIHFDTKNDQVSNFGLIYEKELSENKILFIDDTITTGSTFRSINFFLENTITKQNGKSFDACFVLLDRSNFYTNKQVTGKIEKYYSFANLNLPSIKDYSGQCPLDSAFVRFNDLIENSFLTKMKIHFLQQKDKLEERAINLVKQTEKDYVFQVEAIHRIYEWCGLFLKEFDDSFYEWKKSLFENTKSPFKESKLKTYSYDNNNLSRETTTILKVLSHSPFIHYKPIKEKTFYWILDILKTQITKIENEISRNDFKYESFRDLKFIIRRAGLLNTNFLISKDIFHFLKNLYSLHGLEKLKNNERNETQQIIFSIGQQELLFNKREILTFYQNQKVSEFHIFYTAQIKELLFLNEARSIHLEKTINDLKEDAKFYQNTTKSYKQLLRIIQEENGILFLNFWKFIQKKVENISFDKLKDNDAIINVLNQNYIINHYRTKTLIDFFSHGKDKSDNLLNNPLFISFLKLMHFFEIDKNQLELKLNEKSDFIMNQILEIFNYRKETSMTPDNKNSGAFLLVKYKQEADTFVAFNRGDIGKVDNSTLINDTYLKEFLNPDDYKNKTKTIIEFHKNDGKWIDLYSVEEDVNEVQSNMHFNFVPEGYNRVLLVRFNKIVVEPEKPDEFKKFEDRIKDHGQAIAGFYFKRTNEEITDISLTRYLLLLRLPFCNFISRHHENDEFRDWVEADNIRKLALLSGHSREMLLRISGERKDEIVYKDIVLNLEHIQTIVALGNNITNITGDNDIKERFFRFYNVQGSEEIKVESIQRLGIMAKHIFEFTEIENHANCKIRIVYDNNLSFAFHKSLLEIICFELLINAKKNRWHFSEDENGILDEKLFFTQMDEDKRKTELIVTSEHSKMWNYVEIDASHIKEKMVLKISNTGPTAKDALLILKRNQSPKGEDTIAGLKLIMELMKRKAFGQLGEIDFDEKILNSSLGLSKFIVELTFNPMTNG